MPRNIDTALLRAFTAVAETGGMTSAARLLNVTQAAVSQQIKRLEDSFGSSLFERDRRGFRLTPTGERLLARAQRLLSINDEIWSTMTAPDVTGEVRVGIPADIVRPYLPSVLRRFYEAWPRTLVTLVCDSSQRLLAKLDDGEMDLAMTTEAGCGRHGETLLTRPLVWVGARGGHAWERDPLPIATGDDSCSFRPVVLKTLTEAGRDWRSVCEVNSFEPICATVEADLAVAPLLASTVPEGIQILGASSGLPRLPDFSVNLYMPRMGASEIALEFVHHLRAHLNDRIQRAA